MPRNIYISHGTNSEQDLYEDLIAESIQIYGHDVYYLPRTIVELDSILNEDVTSTFDSSYICEMYVESIDGFEGEGKLITKFGLEIRDQLTFVVSVRRWNELIGRFETDQVRPNEGDLIYVPFTKGLFVIKFVEDKKPFFQLNDTPTYKLICELFEYANQDMNTGVSEIDAIQRYSSQGFGVIVQHPNAERFVLSEILIIELPSGVTGSAELLKQSDTLTLNEERLYLGPLTWDDGVFHVIPETGSTLTGAGTTGDVNFVFSLDNSTDDDTSINDDNAQNNSFEIDGGAFIDFSEDNPFSDVIN
jgi:hypothetical protein